MNNYDFSTDFDIEHFDYETNNEKIYDDFEINSINEKVFCDGIDEYYKFANEEKF